MRRSASEVIRNLEKRIARLERQAIGRGPSTFLQKLESALRSERLPESLEDNKRYYNPPGYFTTNKNVAYEDYNSLSATVTVAPVPNLNDVGEVEITNKFALFDVDEGQDARKIKKQLEAKLAEILTARDDEYISAREGFSAFSRAHTLLDWVARARDFGYSDGHMLTGEGDLKTKPGFKLSVRTKRKDGYLFFYINFSKVVEFTVRDEFAPIPSAPSFGDTDYFARRDFQRDLYNTTRRDLPR